MGLFVAKQDSFGTVYDWHDAINRLANIVQGDTGFAWDDQNTAWIEGAECVRLSYIPTLSGPTMDRINDLINNNFKYPPNLDIVIFPVKDPMTEPTGTSVPFGLSLAPGVATNPLLFNVCCIYNAKPCGGKQQVENKYSGGTTPSAPQHSLYYELAHCWKYVTQSNINDDVQAATDENDLRDLYGDDRIATMARGVACDPTTTNCFPSWTRVLTPSGWARIADLEAGDLVLSFRRQTGRMRTCIVTKRLDHLPAQLWVVGTHGTSQIVTTTEFHPFLTRRGWVLTNRLRFDDELVTLEGHRRITLVRKTEKYDVVHNIHTSGEHTFIVEGGVVVHNFAYFRALRSLWHRAFLDPKGELSRKPYRTGRRIFVH